MLGACRDDWESGLVLLLLNTGMHSSVFCNPRRRTGKPRKRPNILRNGSARYISFKRPKTNKALHSFPFNKDDFNLIKKFLASPAKSNKHYDEVSVAIGHVLGMVIQCAAVVIFGHKISI